MSDPFEIKQQDRQKGVIPWGQNNDISDLDRWCTLKEYRHVSPWAKEKPLRTLQLLAKRGEIPAPVRKLPLCNGFTAYLVEITDPNELEMLVRYRKIHLARKESRKIAMRMIGEKSKGEGNHGGRRNIKHVRAKVPDYLCHLLCTRVFLESFMKYAEDATQVEPDRFEKIREKRVYLNGKSYRNLQSLAASLGCSVGAAFHIRLLEYLQTAQGQVAAIVAGKLSAVSSNPSR